jgi:hypothetical protein
MDDQLFGWQLASNPLLCPRLLVNHSRCTRSKNKSISYIATGFSSKRFECWNAVNFWGVLVFRPSASRTVLPVVRPKTVLGRGPAARPSWPEGFWEASPALREAEELNHTSADRGPVNQQFRPHPIALHTIAVSPTPLHSTNRDGFLQYYDPSLIPRHEGPPLARLSD